MYIYRHNVEIGSPPVVEELANFNRSALLDPTAPHEEGFDIACGIHLLGWGYFSSANNARRKAGKLLVAAIGFEPMTSWI